MILDLIEAKEILDDIDLNDQDLERLILSLESIAFRVIDSLLMETEKNDWPI